MYFTAYICDDVVSLTTNKVLIGRKCVIKKDLIKHPLFSYDKNILNLMKLSY